MSDFITVSSFSFSELEDQLNEARHKVRGWCCKPPLALSPTPPRSSPAQPSVDSSFPHSYQMAQALRNNYFFTPTRKAIVTLM